MTVATTAGAHNHNFVKSLGATHVFDHKATNVVDEILKVLKPGDVVFDCIAGPSVQEACAGIVSKLGGGKLATVLWPAPSKYSDVEILLGMFPSLKPALVF